MNSTNSSNDTPPTADWADYWANLLYRLQKLEQRQEQVAQTINELANGIAYPISSVYQIRDSLRQIAAILRGESPPSATP